MLGGCSFNNILQYLNDNNYETLGSLLEDISDIERLVRRVELGIMHPYELYLLYISLYQIDKLVEFCNKKNLFNIDNNFNVNPIIDYINATFNLKLIPPFFSLTVVYFNLLLNCNIYYL